MSQVAYDANGLKCGSSRQPTEVDSACDRGHLFRVVRLGHGRHLRSGAPQPERLIAANGDTLMTDGDIVAGKAGFQKADLMDYGSLYGIGSYYGEDYTAFTLIRLAGLVENNLAPARFGTPYRSLSTDQQAAIRDAMCADLQRNDLIQRQVTIPEGKASVVRQTTLRLNA